MALLNVFLGGVQVLHRLWQPEELPAVVAGDDGPEVAELGCCRRVGHLHLFRFVLDLLIGDLRRWFWLCLALGFGAQKVRARRSAALPVSGPAGRG